MKAVLVVDVPEDWEKGDCVHCQLSQRRLSNTGAPGLICRVCSDKADCPLEVQDNIDVD